MTHLKSNRINFPYSIDNSGLTSKSTDHSQYVKQLIEQVLFTAQGERVNRPEFGTGLNLLIFEPNSIPLSSTSQTLIQSSLQHWLGGIVTIQSVSVTNDDSKLHISIKYILNKTQESMVADFVKG